MCAFKVTGFASRTVASFAGPVSPFEKLGVKHMGVNMLREIRQQSKVCPGHKDLRFTPMTGKFKCGYLFTPCSLSTHLSLLHSFYRAISVYLE